MELEEQKGPQMTLSSIHQRQRKQQDDMRSSFQGYRPAMEPAQELHRQLNVPRISTYKELKLTIKDFNGSGIYLGLGSGYRKWAESF